MYNTFWYTLGKILGFIVLAAVIVTVCGYAIMLLWNWLMPVLFNLTTITFWQAIGLDILVSLLFLPGIHFNVNKSKQDYYY